jgi:hypothetical protein
MSFWIAYFVFAFLIVSFDIYADAIYSNQISSQLYYFSNDIFTAFGLVGIFGYAFRKRIFSPITWKLFFLLIIIWDIPASYLLTSECLDVPARDYWITFWTNFIIGWVLWIPYYIALFLYAFKFVKRDKIQKQWWYLNRNAEERILENEDGQLGMTVPFRSECTREKPIIGIQTAYLGPSVL